ncbi:unnamed protein product [Ceutorhynchus assimilis]|uniref:Uncharacterized protein n=1 Tax=Ceutorhynchus assimilis TaxID=467358 RepID=A0A9N9MZZ1_9CUCU|nr:unnamed protein product [Ceutorhynchus assimilis]
MTNLIPSRTSNRPVRFRSITRVLTLVNYAPERPMTWPSVVLRTTECYRQNEKKSIDKKKKHM